MGKQLVAFALVAEEFEKTGDPILGLKPLFAPLVRDKADQEFDPEVFASDFSSLYGLQMSAFVARALAERLVEIGLLVRTYDAGHGERFHVARFEWQAEAIQEHQIEQTVELFVAWSQKQVGETGFSFSDAQLENAILSRLSRPEFASIFTRAAEDKPARLKGMLGLAALDVSAKADAFLDFLVAQFLLEAATKAPEVFAAVSKISYGSLIADAVAGLALPAQGDKRSAPDLKAILDGPLLLDLLDLNSREHKIYAEGFLGIVRDAGIRVAVFEHSLDEIRLTIDATLASDSRGEGFGPMAHRFRTEPGQRALAAMVRDSVRSRAEELGIEVVFAEHFHSVSYLKFFSEERLDEVRNSIGDLHAHVDARARDAESVAAVARMKGTRSQAETILDAGAIFITRNSVLCKRVLRTLSRGRSDPMPRFTIATDGQLAGILWFVRGVEGLSLSRKRLIANCSAAVLPGRDVVARIAMFLEQVRPELRENFEAMMTDSRASLCTMRLTGGDPDAVDQGRALEVVEAMRRELAAPALEKLTEAEIQAAASRAEAARIAAESKETVAILQGSLGGLEDLRERDAKDFDLRIAQFQIDLETANERTRRLDEEEASRRHSINQEIIENEGILEGKVQRTFRIFEFALALLPIGAAIASFVGEIRPNIWLAALSLVASLVTVGVIEKFFRENIKALIRRLYRADSRYIEGLRSALNR